MSVCIASLNSGSNGNCYYVSSGSNAVLIDVGISYRETSRRMQRLGLSLDNIDAIFISHEHTDHLRGLHGILKKHNLPVYFSAGTLAAYRRQYSAVHNYLLFEEEVPVKIGNLLITPFSKQHDAAEPHSFIVEQGGTTVGVITDIGVVCDNTKKYFSKCHAAFLEANYDEQMLEGGRYPYYLKQRIRGGRGHISNRQALELFRQHRHPELSHLLLSHLSRDNNDPQLVKTMFDEHALDTEIVVASRYQESAVYTIGRMENIIKTAIKEKVLVSQLSIFSS